jgi:hypothetical protein
MTHQRIFQALPLIRTMLLHSSHKSLSIDVLMSDILYQKNFNVKNVSNLFIMPN